MILMEAHKSSLEISYLQDIREGCSKEAILVGFYYYGKSLILNRIELLENKGGSAKMSKLS